MKKEIDREEPREGWYRDEVPSLAWMDRHTDDEIWEECARRRRLHEARDAQEAADA